jgi:predicted site-specific integrase-resolvase
VTDNSFDNHEGRLARLSWFATKWGVTPTTVKRWSRRGQLPPLVRINQRLFLLPVRETLAAFDAMTEEVAHVTA